MWICPIVSLVSQVAVECYHHGDNGQENLLELAPSTSLCLRILNEIVLFSPLSDLGGAETNPTRL